MAKACLGPVPHSTGIPDGIAILPQDNAPEGGALRAWNQQEQSQSYERNLGNRDQ